ncbi:MAG TPA: hypothetical protein VJ372_17885 [Pyrinomonadaceae bacterium]|jgi:hypothetical protein|nr:hypothetical protein [Pyrinomonadaceae bacterium]
MTKNQKIALGCGGAGCFGLIIVVIVGVAVYFVWVRPAVSARSYNFNVSTNRNANSDSNSNSASNDNSNSNSDSSSKSTSASSMSDDDKHKLYQAATMTGDTELLRRVSVKLGLMNDDFSPGDEYAGFLKDHVTWVFQNTDFIQSINSKEKAVAYVNEHFPD